MSDEKNQSQVVRSPPSVRDGVGKKRKRKEVIVEEEEEDEDAEDDEYSRLSRQ